MQVQKINLNNIGRSKGFAADEAYKSLLTNLQFCGNEVQIVTMTSCMPNEGKSTVSLELSKGLASIGKKVLFIDADMRNSVVVNKYTNARGIKGLSQLLSGQVSLSDVLYETQYEGFYIIFSGQVPPNPTDLLNGNKFKSLINSSKEIFDYVIIDTPPLGLVIDAAVIANCSDSAVLVCGSGKVSYRLAQNVIKQLNKSGCNIIGAVLNDVSKKGKRGRYYYSYAYGKEYGKEYSKGYGHRYREDGGEDNGKD
ncbi:MAG: CpsD/CapB family tyrosine-protein kinase [Clostridia bacterium]|nr:CpsD/CapB family tyrosine-protein kinase [Clostridia bacterium]